MLPKLTIKVLFLGTSVACIVKEKRFDQHWLQAPEV